MEAIGKLIAILPEQSGQTERGSWVRGGFVIETEEQYPKKIAFTLFGERVAMIKSFAMGSILRVQFSAESREYEGRWYTDLRCFRIDTFNPAPMGGGYPGQQPNYNPGVAPQPQATQMPTQPAPDFASNPSSEMMGTDDDLPF